MYPTEFVESFEAQYPKISFVYELPESLDKCPQLKQHIRRIIHAKQRLELIHNDATGIKYDLITRTYKDKDGKSHALTTKGYDVISEIAYRRFGGNLSPRAFIFILQDLEDLKPYKFNASLAIMSTKYNMEKAMALQASWSKFCTQQSKTFKMDYTEFKEFLNSIKEDEEDEVNTTDTPVESKSKNSNKGTFSSPSFGGSDFNNSQLRKAFGDEKLHKLKLGTKGSK